MAHVGGTARVKDYHHLPSELKIEEPTPKKTKSSGIHNIRNH